MQFCVYFTVSLGKNDAVVSENSSPAPLDPSLVTGQFHPDKCLPSVTFLRSTLCSIILFH